MNVLIVLKKPDNTFTSDYVKNVIGIFETNNMIGLDITEKPRKYFDQNEIYTIKLITDGKF